MPQLFIIAVALVSLGLFAMILGIVNLMHREKMAMIERGMDPRSYKSLANVYKSLKWSLLLIGSGCGLLLAYLLDATVLKDQQNSFFFYTAMVAIFGGLGLFVSYIIEKKNTPAQ